MLVLVAVALRPLGVPLTSPSGGMHTFTMVPMSSRPPVVVLPASDAVAAAVPSTALRRSKAVMVGSMDSHKATAPLTWGVAMDVPL